MSKTDKAVRSLKSTDEIYPLVKKYYADSWTAKENHKFVAWVGVGDPRELFWAMDLVPVYPENFSATCGAKQIAGEACAVAEEAGYAREICSYFRNTYGFMTDSENLPRPPGGGMAKPDLLVLAVNSCHTRPKWWRIMERYYNVPTFIFEAPTLSWDMRRDNLEEYYLQFIIKQLQDLVTFLEKHTKKRLSMDRLKQAIFFADRASALIEEIYELRKLSPCPVGAEDMVSAIFPIIAFRGTQLAVDFYQKMLDEVKARVSRGEGVLQEEKIRLMIDNIPPWYTKGLYNYFHQFNALSVTETYTTNFGWQSRMDPEKPWESLARGVTCNWLNISYEEKKEEMLKTVVDYKVDGAIFLVNKSCKVYTGSNTFLANELKDKLNISSLILTADQTDPRDYADAQIKNRISAFMEMLEG